MNTYKNFKDDALTADWLKDNGLHEGSFSTTHIKLLQAQQHAHVLLSQHKQMLSEQQQKVLKNFQRLMDNKKTRSRLKPTAAHSVFNINSQINRQLFKQFRKIKKSIT